jgi:hypothetical protein
VAADPSRLLFRLYRHTVEPWHTRSVRRKRLALFGHDALNPLPTVVIDPAGQTAACGRDCLARAANHRRYMGRMRAPTHSPRSARTTALLLDLTRFPTLADYEREVRRLSRGAVARRARKAEQAGYRVKPVNGLLWAPDIAAIQRSKWFRSGGLVPWVLIPKPFKKPEAGQSYAVVPPRCARHWIQSWGIMIDAPGHRQGPIEVGERLVGIVNIARCGNYIRTIEILGHGEHLAAGIMDQIYYTVLCWIFEQRAGGLTDGVEFLTYGALEHGRYGLLHFKRKYGFAPYLVEVA